MNQKFPARVLVVLLLLTVGSLWVYAGDSLYGKVLSVSDTAEIVTLAYSTGRYEVRIAGIEIPPPLALEAKRRIESLLSPSFYARIRLVRRDGRVMVAHLLTGDPAVGIKDVGLELLRNKLAMLSQPHADKLYGYKYGELTAAENEGRKILRAPWTPTPPPRPALSRTPLPSP